MRNAQQIARAIFVLQTLLVVAFISSLINMVMQLDMDVEDAWSLVRTATGMVDLSAEDGVLDLQRLLNAAVMVAKAGALLLQYLFWFSFGWAKSDGGFGASSGATEDVVERIAVSWDREDPTSRSSSIKAFEYCFIASAAVDLGSEGIGTATLFGVLDGDIPAALAYALLGGTLSVLVVRLLLWFAVSRRANRVARMAVIGFAGLSVLRVVSAVATADIAVSDGLTGLVALGLTVVGSLLYCASAYFLLTPDAKAWYRFRNERAPQAS